MRALDTPAWAATHAVLRRAESLYWSAKEQTLDVMLGARTLRDYLGVEWLSRHPRVLPALQELEIQIQDIARQA